MCSYDFVTPWYSIFLFYSEFWNRTDYEKRVRYLNQVVQCRTFQPNVKSNVNELNRLKLFLLEMLYEKLLRIIKNFDATFNELLGFDVLFEGWKVETSVDLVWTCLGRFSCWAIKWRYLKQKVKNNIPGELSFSMLHAACISGVQLGTFI